MFLTKTALKRPVSCVLLIISLIIFGVYSLFGFKLQLIPDMEYPMMIVYTAYPGADPESVDELVTKVVEDAGSSLSGVKTTSSYSMENVSMVLFQYDYGSDMDDCYADLRASLDTASLSLPEDVKTPTVIQMNINSMPCMMISAIEQGDIDLLKVVEDSVVPELEKIQGTAEVSLYGGQEEYIKVELDEVLMNQYGLTMSSIANMLASCDFTYPAGDLNQGSQNVSVVTSMRTNTAELLKSVPLTTSTGSVITLQDVALVKPSMKEAQGMSRYNGQDNVSLQITNKSSFGTVNVCRDVKAQLEKIKAENPAISFEITYDASDSIIASLLAVAKTLAAGVVLAMIVLFVFFGDFKASLIVGSSMPISLLMTLVLMNAAGFSMNVVTMGSLVIAIGMMVDSSIVVIESCFRAQERTPDFKEAALEGTGIITASIIASTITTIVVYLPISLTKGLSGQMFSQLGFTIVFAMVASLITALTLVPLFYAKFKPKEKTDIPMNRFLNWTIRGYKKVLAKVLNMKIIVILLSVAMVVASVMMAGTLDMELMGSTDEGVVDVSVGFRSGTNLEAMDEAIRYWEQVAADEEDVEYYTVSVGSSGMGGMSRGASSTLSATLKKDRTLSTAEVVDKWNALAATIPGYDITVSSSGNSTSSMMSGGSYAVDLQGKDMEELEAFSDELATKLSGIDGVVKVANSMASASTRAAIKVDPLKAMQYGLTPIQVGMSLNNAISGTTAKKVTNSGTEYEIKLEYPKGSYDNVNELMNLNLSTPTGGVVPVNEVAELVYEEAQDTIVKEDGNYQVELSASIRSDVQFETQKAIDQVVADTVFPQGISAADNAMNEMMMEEFRTLITAILIAVFLVFLVMAMQFESARFSIMVMMCIPFALIGSFFLMFIMQTTISMISLMGFLMLMGIVVNNGILFIDTAGQLRQEMPVEEALVQAGALRLRPILMTSLTTILAMIPMGLGLGENGEMMQGMALVIIGGMVASTILTLVLIPTIFLIIDKEAGRERRKRFFGRIFGIFGFGKRKRQPAPATAPEGEFGDGDESEPKENPEAPEGEDGESDPKKTKEKKSLFSRRNRSRR